MAAWSVADIEGLVYLALNAADASELEFWSQAELYTYASDALLELAKRYLLLVERDADSVALVADQVLHPVPARHVATIHLSANLTSLRPAAVREIEALDQNWEAAASGTPARWAGDAFGTDYVALYPPASAGGTLEWIYQQYSAELTISAPTVRIPAVLGDYLALVMIRRARDDQFDAAMTDVAQFCNQLTGLYRQVIESYWGLGE